MIPKNENESLNVIGNLSVNSWLDRYTRAIFSEFAIYNANTNLFCVVTLLFEQLPTGSLTPYPSILTLRLFRYVGGEMYFVLTCEIVYLLFCSFFVFKEIKEFVKKGRQHLKNPWSILEIIITLLSLSAVGLYFARLSFTKSALKSMNGNGSSFVSFHYTAFLDEWLKCIMGIIVFLSFLKMFRLLRFNRRMSMLQQVLKRCLSQLLSFMIMFALAFLAFALLACLVFGQSMEGFGTFLRSCASLMDTLLGKFTLKEMSKANRIIGPIFFYSYTVSMVFILINMFLSIINDAFTEVRSDVEKQSNDYEIVDFMIHRLKENIGKSMGHAIHPVYKESKTELEANFDKIADNADNAMHFMRNIAFEDMRKTRWFQTDNCTEKKKNLMRLLMEVDWDYYEEELCDSIPVFERFLNQRSEEELEAILQYYRQKRMVEDLVFKEVNGEDDSSTGSDSDSDDSNGSISDDEKSGNDENASETELVAEDCKRLLTPALGASPERASNHPGSAVRVKSPALLITDVEPTTIEQQHAEVASRKSSFVDPEVDDNELLKILDDVQREVESRCATDAELDSILNGDSLSNDDRDRLSHAEMKPRMFDSDPETATGKKNGKKKKRKKKGEEKSQEKTAKEAWMTVTEGNRKGDVEQDEGSEKKKKKKVKKDGHTEKNDLREADDEGDEEDVKPKKKAKEKVVSKKLEMEPKKKKTKGDMTTEGKAEEEANGDEATKKTKRKKIKDITTEENGEEGLNEGEEKKEKKKKKKGVDGLLTEENEEKEINEDEGMKKKKKKRNKEARGEMTTEGVGEEEIYGDEEKKNKKKSKEATADMVTDLNNEEKGNEYEGKKKKKKKNTAAADGTGEEETTEVKETPKKKNKKKTDELDDIFEETLELSDTDQAEIKKKKKKKGKVKTLLALEEDHGQSSIKSDEKEEGKEKEERKERTDEESEC